MKRKSRWPSMVYFITAGPFVKIGWTGTGFSDTRLENMQTGCPYRMEIEIEFQGTKRDEAYLHWYFADSHEHREWFRREGRLRTFLDSIPPFVAFTTEQRDKLLADAREFFYALPHLKTAWQTWKTIPNTRDTLRKPFTWGAA